MQHIYSPTDSLFQGSDLKSYQQLNIIKLYFLHQNLNCEYFDKEILLYNHEALTSISEGAIITDSFIFINQHTFNDILNSFEPDKDAINYFNYLKKIKDLIINEADTEDLLTFQKDNREITTKFSDEKLSLIIENMPITQFIKNVSQYKEVHNTSLIKSFVKQPFVTLSDQDFLKHLKDSNLLKSLGILKNEINNKNKSFLQFESRLDFSKQHKQYLNYFKEKTLPAFIFNYNSLILKNDKANADILLDYFIETTCHETKDFSSLSFGLVVHTIFNFDYLDTYYQYINKLDFKNKGIELIAHYRELDTEAKNYLINCGTGLPLSDFLVQLSPENKLTKQIKRF